MKENIIYIIESNIKQQIFKLLSKNKYKIKINKKKIKIPDNILKVVNLEWEKFRIKNKNIAKNNTTYFFSKFNKNKGIDFVTPNSFKYAHTFVRCEKFQKYSWLADASGLCALSSLCLVITSDNKIILGMKSNMDNKISGFSGYPLKNKGDIEKNSINIHKYITRTVCEELNIRRDNISKIFRIGQTYSPNITDRNNKLNIKVFNNNYIIKTKENSLEIKRKFKKDFQFKKLLFIENNVAMLKKFILNNYDKMSVHCIAAFYNYLALKCSISELNEFLYKLAISSTQIKLNKKLGNMQTNIFLKKLNPLIWGLFGRKNIKNYTVADKMWEALFKKKCMPIKYFLFGSNQEKKLFSYLDNLKKNPAFVGCNIAMPWKKLFYEQCDRIENNSIAVKTINTIVKNKDGLYGYNTDGIGLINSIKSYTNLENKIVFLIGAGGAAQTVPYWLLKEKISKLYIFDIDEEKKNSLIHCYSHKYHKKEIIGLNKKDINKIMSNIDILINATPCGMRGENKQLPLNKLSLKLCKKSCLFVEMVYNPNITPMLKYAKKNGNYICPGVNMLVEQAAVSFFYAFGCDLTKEEKEVMKNVALKGVK